MYLMLDSKSINLICILGILIFKLIGYWRRTLLVINSYYYIQAKTSNCITFLENVFYL